MTKISYGGFRINLRRMGESARAVRDGEGSSLLWS